MKLFPLATMRGQMVQNELSLCRVYWANKNHLFYLQVLLYLLEKSLPSSLHGSPCKSLVWNFSNHSLGAATGQQL